MNNLNGSTPTNPSNPPNEIISNPKKYIYDFATKTPIAVVEPEAPPPLPSQPPPQEDFGVNQPFHSHLSAQNQYQNSQYSSTRTSETQSSQPATYSTPKKPYSFAEELRDQGKFHTSIVLLIVNNELLIVTAFFL